MTFKPGALVILVKSMHPDGAKYLGTVHTLGAYHPKAKAWGFAPPILEESRFEFLWTEPHMKLIDPGTGTDEMIIRCGLPHGETV